MNVLHAAAVASPCCRWRRCSDTRVAATRAVAFTRLLALTYTPVLPSLMRHHCQATLRPEIQLLNGLLAAEGPEARAQVRYGGYSAPRSSVGRSAWCCVGFDRRARHPCPPCLQVLASGNAAEALSMNERYFFGLLSRMIADVRRQPESEQRDDLLAKLEGIERDAEASAAAAPSSS